MKPSRKPLSVDPSRRDFVALASVVAGSVAGIPGCDRDAEEIPGNAMDGGVVAAADAGPDTSPDTLPATCGELTQPNIEGPFFTPNSPARTNIRMPGALGTLLRVRGRVRSSDCRVLSGILLDFWQADDAGAYQTVGFNLRGHQFTDAEGRFTLESIVPGRYLNGDTFRPAHIHVKVAGAGFMQLTTQLYFPGDPFNTDDPFIHPDLIMTVSDGAGGVKQAGYDFVLAPA